MKNKMLKLATGLFCLGLAATFTACGDDDSSSTGGNTEKVSCYSLTAFDNDGDTSEWNEACLEAEAGTKVATIINNFCTEMAKYLEKGEKAELGKGCPSKKALYTCNTSYKSSDYTSYYYQIDSEDTENLVVKGDEKKTCENLTKDEQGEFAAFEK